MLQFRERRLGESRYVWADAVYEKVLEDERVESMAVVIATRVEEWRADTTPMNMTSERHQPIMSAQRETRAAKDRSTVSPP